MEHRRRGGGNTGDKKVLVKKTPAPELGWKRGSTGGRRDGAVVLRFWGGSWELTFKYQEAIGHVFEQKHMC